MNRQLLLTALTIAMCWLGYGQASALSQVDGVYQISNANDLKEFSNMVASGNGNIDGALTQDIDMRGVNDFQPIGTTSSPYTGTFDGQQHYVRKLIIDLPEQEYVGLFGVLANGAYIKNVIVDDFSSIVGLRFVGGIAGGTKDGGSVTFENCGNEATVGATEENAAGICGVSMGSDCGIRMINCFNTGGISGGRESAALCGWVGNTGSVIQNCYNAGWVIGMDGSNSLWRNGNGKGSNNFDTYGNQGTLISEDEYDLSCGAVCYQINGNQSDNVVWFQELGVDMHPVPFSSHGTVYAVGDLYCDGTSKGGDLTFSNSNESNRDPHSFNNGVCTNCGDVDVDYLTPYDGFYEISSADELNWFAALVNHGHPKVNARLTSDIDFSSYTSMDVMIGGDAYTTDENASLAFEGIFDGDEHTVTVNYYASYDGVALFKVVRDATIRNLIVEGNIDTNQRFAAGLAFVTRGATKIQNVIVDVNIAGTYPGDATHGGIVAVSHENPTYSNCAFIGSINAPDCEGTAAIIGYSHSYTDAMIENCFVAPTLLSMTGNSTIFARNVRDIVNCYYTDNIVDLWEDNATMVSEAAVASGELCYLLCSGATDGAWRQDIGSDSHPFPFESHGVVYANGSINCDGTLSDNVTYSNTKSSATQQPHNYVNDVCTVCGARIIRTGQQLKALADEINNGEIDGNIIVDLANDIDLSGIEYAGIGTRFSQQIDEENWEDVKRPYMGTFDGHGFHIKNMIIDSQDGNKGLIALASGATIKNVVVDNSCEIYSTGYSAGIVGTVIGRGTLTIENCGNEAMVNVGADGANGAGILGVNDLSEAYVRIINCYNTGDIVGQRECGGISGWLGDRFEVRNCYNTGIVAPEAVDGTRTFARYNGNAGVIENCFEAGGVQVFEVSFEDVSSGKLCYDINQGAGKTIFYQTLGEDEHPVLDKSHLRVVYQNGQYVNSSSATAIENVEIRTKNAESQCGIFDLQGRRISGEQKGVQIVRLSDGTTRTVIVK